MMTESKWRRVLATTSLMFLSPVVVAVDTSSSSSSSGRNSLLIESLLPAFMSKCDDDFPTCGYCWCVPEENEECPEPSPETCFKDLIPILREFRWEHPITLDCNPYVDQDCDTDPELETGGACVIDLIPPENDYDDACPTGWAYKTRTVDAADPGEIVTHAGACGTCSSLQDLAAYMMAGPDLTDLSSACYFLSLASESLGLKCYEYLGFTEGCAKIWLYNSINTNEDCRRVCLAYTISGEEANGPPPNCTLADCLTCNEVSSGKIFEKFAGRLRRNSGLRSGIVRNCSDVADIVQTNPCDLV